MSSETLTQAGLIAQLRWRLFRSSLRTARGKLELAGQMILSVLASVVAIGGGLALYGIGLVLIASRHVSLLHAVLWGIFLAWLLLPLLLAAATTAVDFRELLRFPLRHSTYLLLSLTYSVFEPAALAMLFWVACLFAGVATARPAIALQVAPAFLAFAAVSLLLSRAVTTAVERLFRRRRGREVFFTVFVLAMLATQALTVASEDYLELAWRQVAAHAEWSLLFPPGLAYTVLQGALAGNAALPAAGFAVLALYAALLFGRFQREVRAQYRGEDLGAETTAAAPPSAQVAPGWRLPVLSASLAAMFEKEVRYVMRNSFTLMNLAIPIFLPVIFGVVMAGGKEIPEVLTRDSGATFFGFVAYSLMVTMHLVANQFAFEGVGMQFFFVAPVRFREVIVAKNLAYATAILLDVLLIWLVLAAVGRAPSVVATVAVLAALPFLLLAQVVGGNFLSLYFPRRFDFGKFKQRQSGMSALLGLLQQVITVAIAGGVYGLAMWLDLPWAAALVYLVLSAAMWQIYRLALDHYENIAAARSESLIGELCRD